MLRTLAMSLVMVGTIGLSSTSALLGDIPLVNQAQGTGNITLDFATAGTHQQLGIFLINSNDPAGFHVTFTFTNKGFFKVGSRQFAMTNIVLNKISGTLGGGLAEPANMPITLDGSGSWTWSPGVPTTETDGFLVEIAADGSSQATGIAGFYQERISCVIASGP
jgi:hypothetical protein